MATFKFGRYIDIHWNGYDIQGPADTVFSIPDQLYEEFDADIAPVEPTLQWIDTNEFQTLSNSVSAATLSATFPIALSTSTSGKTISFSSSTNPNGYLLAADGSGGVIFTPASTSGLTSVVGVSPISTVVSGGTVSVSLDASYQTAGTYVTSVIGTSPVSASGTTAITVSIDQTTLSVADASTAATLRTYVKNSSGSTITKGQVVYITGADGTNALIGLASNTSDAASSKTLGIAANTMTNNAFGYVIENGQLSNIDTSAATAGSAVWLGSTPGSYQFTVPDEPNHAVYLGVVTKANVSTGEILVKVQNGYELNELHDVFTTGVSSSLPLVYNATSDGWIAQALSSVGIADNAIVTTKILDGAVTSAKLATDSVGAAAISAGAVGTSELATGAVTSAAIAAGAVGSAAISSGAINSTHIGANAVVAGNIAANAVTSGNIAAGAVNTAKIDSTGGSATWVLTANGSGGATFAAPISSVNYTVLTGSGTWNVPSGVSLLKAVLMIRGGDGGTGGSVRTTTANNSSTGGAGGDTERGVYYENISIYGTTSLSYSVGLGGAGGAGATFTKAAGSSSTANTAGTAGTGGVDSTLGTLSSAFSNTTVGYPRTYELDPVLGAAAATNSAATNVYLISAGGTNQVRRPEIKAFGYFDIAQFLGTTEGNAGQSSIVTATITSGSVTASGGAGGSGDGFYLGSGGGGSVGSTPSITAAGSGFKRGAGGGASAYYYKTTTDGANTVTITGGNGGNGLDGFGGGGGGGGAVLFGHTIAASYNTAVLSLTAGSGGDGGDGTIIIWW